VAVINKIIHERARLLIMTYLASSKKTAVSFNELQKRLDFTSGNLSVQLSNLKHAKYIVINKTFKDNKPFTTIAITAAGTQALNRYLEDMERIINTLKNAAG